MLQGGAGRLLLHEFPCKQHVEFKNARYSRKHINLLLLDNCEEYSKTYGVDGRPLEHATISALAAKRAAKYKATLVEQRSQKAPVTVDTSFRSKDVWQCAYAEGGQEAADFCKMVNNKRTPIGTFFGLANASLPRAKEVINKVPNMRPISLAEVRANLNRSKTHLPWLSGSVGGLDGYPLLTVILVLLQEVVLGACRDVQVLKLESPGPVDATSQAVYKAPRQEPAQQKPRPWLMPHQLGTRIMGRRV